MFVLSNQDIVRKIKSGELVIKPFNLERVSEDSVDLCLSGEYMVFERIWRLEAVDLSQQIGKGFLGGKIGLCVERIANQSSLVLRPGQVIIAYLEEEIGLPNDLCAVIDGKSKWAQLGLQVASAGLIHAGWRGVPVLELVNLGNIPLKLQLGLPICQIRFQPLSSPAISSDELMTLWKGEE